MYFYLTCNASIGFSTCYHIWRIFLFHEISKCGLFSSRQSFNLSIASIIWNYGSNLGFSALYVSDLWMHLSQHSTFQLNYWIAFNLCVRFAHLCCKILLIWWFGLIFNLVWGSTLLDSRESHFMYAYWVLIFNAWHLVLFIEIIKWIPCWGERKCSDQYTCQSNVKL
jgi:hypothetical protein